MLTFSLIALAALIAAAATYYYFFAKSSSVSGLDFADAINDPLLQECRAELDDHTLVYARPAKDTTKI